MTRPTLVFDLDGTLVDTAPDLVAALNVALALENLAPMTVQEVRRLVGGGVRVMLERGLEARTHSVTSDRFDELAAAFLAHYEIHIADASRPYPEVGDVLDDLARRGYALAICTNKPFRFSVLLLDALGLRDGFLAVCGADTFSAKKPDAIHLLGTIERAGGDVTSAVMIGDSRADLDVARNAGIPCVLLDYGYTDVPVSELGADRVISHFRDVPKAVAELLQPLSQRA